MKRKISTLMVVSAALAIGLALMPLSAAAKKPSPNVAVNCDAGQSIQAALNKASPSVPVTLTVAGVCEEDVTIERDDVTINGNNNATIVGTVYVHRSDRINILNVELTGPSYAILASSSDVYLINVTVADNTAWAAVIASNRSSLDISGSTISDNRGEGVFIGGNSHFNAYNNTVVNDNDVVGIHLWGSSSAYLTDGTSVQGNLHGIQAETHSMVDIENVDLSGNIGYGIHLFRDAGARLRTGNVINGNGFAGVYCDDAESSFANDGSTIVDPVYCTGFDQ